MTRIGEVYSVCFDRLIGNGSFGKVYEGKTASGILVAVKYADKTSEKAIKNEVELLCSLQNEENIVKFIGSHYYTKISIEKTTEIYSFAMELALMNLHSMLLMAQYSKGLPPDILFDLTIDTCSAVYSLLKKGIAHRDIKQMNILVFNGRSTIQNGRRSKFLFKLCDLGCSRNVPNDNAGNRNAMNSLVGTEQMLHPILAEMLLVQQHNWQTARGYTAEQCDLWSLGMTLYISAVGKDLLPFSSDRNVYINAANKLLEIPDAIGMKFKKQVKNQITKKWEYEYEPIIKLPSGDGKRPKWLSYVLTCIFRKFLHEPSLEYLGDVIKELKTVKCCQFLSIDKMLITEHADMSTFRSLGDGYPTIAESLGYPKNMELYAISLTSIVKIESRKKTLRELNDNSYLVLPKCEITELRAIKKAEIKNESKAIENKHLVSARKENIRTGLQLFEEADEYVKLFNDSLTILITQFVNLRKKIGEEERIRIAMRFLFYLKTVIKLTMICKGKEEKELSLQCDEKTSEIENELCIHISRGNFIIESTKKMEKEVKSTILEDMELYGVPEKLLQLQNNSTTPENILASTQYCKTLIEQCSSRRDKLLTQMFENGKYIQKLIKLTKSLIDLSFDHSKLNAKIMECQELLEEPFKEMNKIVNSHFHEFEIDADFIRKSIKNFSQELKEEKQLEMNSIEKLVKKLTKNLNEIHQKIDDKSDGKKTAGLEEKEEF